MNAIWSAAFRRSSLAPCLFVVAGDYEDLVLEWVKSRELAGTERSGVFSSSETGWAFEDGGITAFDRYGFGSMPSAIRVIGWACLRSLITDLELRPPRRALLGEPEKNRTEQVEPRPDAAEILSAYFDGPTLRWVVYRLLGDVWVSGSRPEYGPAPGSWGEAGFTTEAMDLLAPTVSIDEAVRLGRRLGHLTLDEAAPDQPFAGIGGWTARHVLELLHAGGAELDRWESAGIEILLAARAIETGMTLSEAQAWLALGCVPMMLSSLGAAHYSPSDLTPYMNAGVSVREAKQLADAAKAATAMKGVMGQPGADR